MAAEEVPMSHPATASKNSDGTYTVRIQHTSEGSITEVHFGNVFYAEVLANAYANILNGVAVVESKVDELVSEAKPAYASAKADVKKLISEAEAEAQKLISSAKSEASLLRAEADGYAASAKKVAEKIASEAKAEAEKLLNEARDKASSILKEAAAAVSSKTPTKVAVPEAPTSAPKTAVEEE